MREFRMPTLGADMEAGTLVDWLKQPGDRIQHGDVIADVETDKGVIGVEAFTDGILDRIVVPVGDRVPVGTVLAWIRDESETPGTAPVVAPAAPVEKVSVAAPSPAPPTAEVPQAAASRERLPMSPSARRLARELHVDPATVHGTGPGGAITREDIQHAAESPAVPSPAPAAKAAAPSEDDRFARMRQAIAAAMSRSKREIPHYYLSTTIDLQPALDWLEKENEQRPITERLLYGVLLVKAVALALKETPELNGVWEGNQAVRKPDIHVGVAISLRQGGLIAPAIHDIDKKSLGELMADFRDLVNRARNGGLRSSELSDPTITVTSLGEQGVETVFGVIYPPQVAIVGFGKVVERPWSVDGQIVSRKVITASLAADHRVSDGHRGGRFLAAVERLLQEPEKL